MSHPRSSVDGRDDRAADRDDTADRRDDTTRDRDEAAHQRDTEADKRDEQARDSADDLTGHIRQIGRQIVDRLARIENTTLDPADWPDLTPAALARLEARITEQRRLAGLDRAPSAPSSTRSSAHSATVDTTGWEPATTAAPPNRTDTTPPATAATPDETGTMPNETATRRRSNANRSTLTTFPLVRYQLSTPA